MPAQLPRTQENLLQRWRGKADKNDGEGVVPLRIPSASADQESPRMRMVVVVQA